MTLTRRLLLNQDTMISPTLINSRDGSNDPGRLDRLRALPSEIKAGYYFPKQARISRFKAGGVRISLWNGAITALSNNKFHAYNDEAEVIIGGNRFAPKYLLITIPKYLFNTTYNMSINSKRKLEMNW
ncbi:11772_t:CDS:2 [Funneliformis mosseae]|uniref:11772_t:CDS:1 n=1 Tax=Funneliformis mosseae TaxID=27381 RepID=A0A9N9CL57_FUNMO|nr:11772_t:CDS:2 [Funneliformis mosseae]